MTLKVKRKRQKIDWDNIEVTFVWTDPNNPNPLNPNNRLTAEQREKKIIKIAAKIWSRVIMSE